eukprot:4716101-Pyramimonas_sp.AAC.1
MGARQRGLDRFAGELGGSRRQGGGTDGEPTGGRQRGEAGSAGLNLRQRELGGVAEEARPKGKPKRKFDKPRALGG